MAGVGLLMLLDDITALLDDVALMTKVAANKTAVMADDVALLTKAAMQKTSGVLGDDLALNAEQVTGVRADRELPVVWAVAKGSLKNKAVLVPAALLISAFAPWLITPLLMIGGAFLCFEGVEKILHSIEQRRHRQAAPAAALSAEVAPSSALKASQLQLDPVAYEQQKISGAVRTDFILSAEIIAIALGEVSGQPLIQQLAVLVAVAIAITVFVYGIVACIVRMDDVGNWLMRKSSAGLQSLGRGVIAATPWLMRALSIIGTAAMFLVGGSLLVHGMPGLEHWLEQAVLGMGAVGHFLLPVLVHVLVGAIIGALVVAAVKLWQRLRPATTAG